MPDYKAKDTHIFKRPQLKQLHASVADISYDLTRADHMEYSQSDQISCWNMLHRAIYRVPKLAAPFPSCVTVYVYT